MLDDDFVSIREYETVRQNKSFYSESHASILSNAKFSDAYECGLGDFFLDRSRLTI